MIGVLPKNSAYDGGRTEIWIPLVFQSKDTTRNFRSLRSYGRLKPGVTLEQARAEMNVIGARIAQEYPDTNQGWGVTVDLFIERVAGDQLRRSLYVMMAAVGAVLLIGCANLANLTLARGASREKEVAIRGALGAGRGRLIRQFLTESILLSVVGGLAGLALGYGLVAGLKLLIPPSMLPPEASVVVDVRVLLFTFSIAVLTGVIFGLAPALQAVNPSLAASMKEGGRGTTFSRARRRLRGTLVVGEIALAFVLLTGAGLLIRSFEQLQHVNAGFDTTNVLTMGAAFPTGKFKDGPQAAAHVHQVVERIESIPGVKVAAFASALPLSGWGYGKAFQIAGKPVKGLANRDVCYFKIVTDGYFSCLGIQLKKGRSLNATDVKSSPPVAVINETMAKRYFKDEDPIGKRILTQEIIFGSPKVGPEIPWEVVGVIIDEKVKGLDDEKSAGMYVSYAQSPTPFVSLLVKGSVNPESLAVAIRREVRLIDSEQPLTDMRTLERIKTESVASNWLSTTLLGVFAGIALALAAIGIYGVVSYSVAQRTQEIGVRLALGASRGDILGLIVGNGMLLCAIGLALGVGGALALTHVLTSLLFGVSATDPMIMAGMSALLAGAALLACYIPARRAAAVDPLAALRDE